MTTLYITQEFAPFFVEGGLGLTSRGLPERLQKDWGLDHEIILPYYTQFVERQGLSTQFIRDLGAVDESGWTWSAHRLLDPTTPLKVTLLRCDEWYDRPTLYRDSDYHDFPDQEERAIAFGCAVGAYVAYDPAPYRLVHANDWQSGIAAQRLADLGLPILFNIHSGWYRGDLIRSGERIIPGDVDSLLELGLSVASTVVTCSPGYADELASQPDRIGELCRARGNGIVGIVSGVDTAVWDAGAVGRSYQPFDESTVDAGKVAARARLAQVLGRPALVNRPLIGVCGRFVHEKGVDLILSTAETVLAAGEANVILMGGAEEPYKSQVLALVEDHAQHFVYQERFEQDLAWLIYAGSDVTLMPSRVEPCGLNQTIALRYGTLPVVAPTGGLRDTVINRDSGSTDWTGLWIREMTPEGVLAAVRELLGVIVDLPEETTRARIRGMRHSWTWRRTADEFADLYEVVASRRQVDPPEASS